jgi:hypothetical protein
MITNPFLGTPQETGWGMGFAFGFTGPNFTDPPPAVIAPELIDAFNEGRLVGQQSATGGIELSSSCLDLSSERPLGEEVALVGHVFELGMAVKDLANVKHVAGGIAGLIVLFLEIGIPDFTPTPDEIMPSLAEKFTETLNRMGIDSGEVFIGMDIDMGVTGCEVEFSNLFKTAEQARQAAAAMGRPNTAIAHWRLDASGNLEILEAN